MLTESLLAATLTTNAPSQHLSTALKDVGIFQYEIQPQGALRHGFKKSSINPHHLAVSRSHIYAAQASKAVIHVYSREKGNQESTVPFPDRIHSLAFAEASQALILGTEDGKLVLWEVGTGRISTSAASHLQAITQLQVTPNEDLILSGSADTTIQVWSLSELLSFTSSTDSYTNRAGNAPVSTFESHRSAITALSCGHSRSSSNFAISASEDSTCYLWHIQTSQVLRSVLLPSAPTCIAIDPADRAAYFGDETGSISQIDILGLGKATEASDAWSRPSNIGKQQQWKASSDSGSMHCLAISYDSSFLISGHEKGHLLRWDVAKHKVANEISRLGQPITNIQMLRPRGLPEAKQANFDITEVVKPKLEFAAQSEHGSINVPASYKLHAALRGQQQVDENDDNVRLAMTSDGWPESVLDAAVQALRRSDDNVQSQASNATARQAQALKAENDELKRNIAAYKEAELQRMERSIQRMAKREDIDLERRKAYHQAIRDGMDKKAANATMLATDAALSRERDRIDAESDADAFGDKMDLG